MAVVSFLGFVVENIWLALTKGYINNRNMNAPFLLGYGMLILVMYLIIGTPNKVLFFSKDKKRLPKWLSYILYFMLAFIIVCVAEIALGVTFERVSGLEYWDYSCISFHFTKYTSVPTSIAFAALITIFMGWMFDPLMSAIMKMDPRLMKVLSILLVFIMLSDFLISFYKMIKKRTFIQNWCILLKMR